MSSRSANQGLKQMSAFLFLFLPGLAFSQNTKLPVDTATNLVTYQSIKRVPGVSQDELYKRAKDWLAEMFKATEYAIQADDKQSGKIISTGVSSAIYRVGNKQELYYVRYTIIITLIDQRYQYKVKSFRVTFSTIKSVMPVEVYQDPDFSRINATEEPEKFKRIAIERQKLIASQILGFTDQTGKLLSASLEQAMIKKDKSKE